MYNLAMHQNRIIPLSNASFANKLLVGGKAASLGEMIEIGIPVPAGYVVTTDAFIGGMTENLKVDILKAFDNLGVTYVAVRSSAIAEDSKSASWAGQLKTYLNISREDVIEAVEKCWASLKSEHATKYAIANKLHNKQNAVAVIVQVMVDADLAGVLFTANPVTNNTGEYLLESVYGLGELLVQGEVTPESLVISKQGSIISRQASRQKQMLVNKDGINRKVDVDVKGHIVSEKLLHRLLELATKIENHCGTPQDIEWVFGGGKLYIVQSRPITTLTNSSHPEKASPNISKNFNKDDYILSFWVQGVSVFVTDVHNDVYSNLEALFIIDNGMFKQYFTKKAFAGALERGLLFYSSEYAFDQYRANLLAHCAYSKDFYERKIKNHKLLDREVVKKFCESTVKLCKDYTKMNFEFTDKAFAEQENNKIIKRNLQKVARFKDQIRSFMNEVLFEADGQAAQLFAILGKQFNISPNIIENLTQKELIGLFDSQMPDLKKVKLRQKAFVESYNIDEPFEAGAAKEVIEEFKEDSKPKKVITGQTASSGMAKGKAKIIPVDYSNPKRLKLAIETMEIGDILIAETTAPELMAACEKAAAIVTDMGGMLSHAAIVSRELGIPCVVGTVNASKIIKDDDKLIVDASKGEISIIKSDKYE